MSDGKTIKEAIAKHPKWGWSAAMNEAGPRCRRPPSCRSKPTAATGQLNAPKSLRRSLAEQAKREGMSFNTLAVTLLTEGLGRRGAYGD
jgi:antitoxin HicB